MKHQNTKPNERIKKILIELSGIGALFLSALAIWALIAIENIYLCLFFGVVGLICSMQIEKLKHRFSVVCAALAIPFNLFMIGCFLLFYLIDNVF